ncbi:MAG: ribonuclease Y [Candidatus Hydrothermales bacterium]
MKSIIFLFSSFLAGLFVGYLISKKIIETILKRKKEEAKSIIDKAKKEADEILLKAKSEAEDIAKREREKVDVQYTKARKELEKFKKELQEREYQIERKAELLLRKEEELKIREKDISEKEKSLRAKNERAEQIISEELKKLEEISGMTREQAKKELLKVIESEARLESAQLIHRIREEAKHNAQKEASKIIITAMQRIASQVSSESSVYVIPLSSDEMKGRIIGREGRNIRTFESLTGVEVIVDDTPGAVILSSFDPERREIARISMERLISDGRIHPARIEEVVKRTQEEFHEYIRIIGEETILELGLRGMHPELLRYVGRLKFRSSFGQNLLLHSKEVAQLAGMIAGELDLDAEIAKRSALLHDIGKVADPSYEGPHALIGAQIVKRYGESDLVANAIASHHEDTEATSPYGPIVTVADAISGSRPGARRESVEAYIKRIEKLEEIASAFNGVEKAYALQAGRELRIIVQADRISDAEAYELSRIVAKRIEEEVKFPGQIKVTVIREVRAVSYAR